jgi:hypothetical protein
MWFTIIIPYVWMLLISCYSNKPGTVQCLTFFSIFFNQEHLILHAHAIDRWVKYSENQIIVIGMENITQFALQSINTLLLGYNAALLSIISPFSSFLLLVKGIHDFGIALRLKKDPKFNTPGHAEDLAEMQEARNNNVDFGEFPSFAAYLVHKARIFTGIIAIGSTTFFIIAISIALIVDQDFNPTWMLNVSDYTKTGTKTGAVF